MKFKSDIEVQAGLRDGSDDIGTAGQILSSTGSQTNWIDQSSINVSAKLVVIACKNTSGATITKGTPVYQTGTVGATDVIEIAEADASDEDKMAAIGLLQTDINNNDFGNVVITGELLNFTTDPIDGVTPVTGDTIYVKSGGGLTLTKPTGLEFIQNVGLVGKVSGGNAGSITVSSIMRSNDVPTPLYVDHDNQRLGIGATNPDQKLQIEFANTDTSFSGGAGGDWGSEGIRIENTINTVDTMAILHLRNNDADIHIASIRQGSNDSDLGFFFEGAEKVRFTNNGNVGIGTNNPDYLLDLYKSTATTSSTTGTTLQRLWNYVGADINQQKTFIDFVFQDDNDNEYPQVRIGAEVGQNGNSDTQIKEGSGAFVVYTNNATGDSPGTPTGLAERFRVDYKGNVGIGTTSPGAKLTIKGADSLNAFKITDSGDGDGFKVTSHTTQGTYVQVYDASHTQTIMLDARSDSTARHTYFNGGGNVGIGTTSPTAKLQVSGKSFFTNDIFTLQNKGIFFNGLDDFSSGIAGIDSGTSVRIFAGGSEKVRVKSTGNVGINTTSPDFKLDVDGTFGVSDLPGNLTSTSVLVANEITGPELITNGDFENGGTDWNGSQTSPATVTFNGGKATIVSPNGESAYRQQSILVPTNTYKATVDIVVRSGSAKLQWGTGTNASSSVMSATGSYVFYKTIPATNADALFYIARNGACDVDFDNVSVKQVTSASNQIQKRELGTGAFGPTPVGAYLPLAGGTMSGNIDFNDSVRARFGNNDDLQIVHDGSNSYIHNVNVGDLYLRQTANNKDIIFESDNGSGGTATYFYLDGSLVNGTTILGATRFPDNSKIFMGTGGDLVFNHDGTNSFINNLTGDFTIENAGDDLILKSADDFLAYVQGTDIAIQAIGDGKVGLRYNNVEKFQTISTGIGVTGNIQIDSALLSNQENTDIDTGAEVVAQVAHATYTAAFFDFVVKKGTNVRSGTVYACHNGDTTPLVEFTETSTNDLGDTSDVTLSVDISGANMRLLATVTSDDWSVKSLIRAI